MASTKKLPKRKRVNRTDMNKPVPMPLQIYVKQEAEKIVEEFRLLCEANLESVSSGTIRLMREELARHNKTK